jgi:alpha-glucoside transport system substrate-binding protein
MPHPSRTQERWSWIRRRTPRRAIGAALQLVRHHRRPPNPRNPGDLTGSLARCAALLAAALTLSACGSGGGSGASPATLPAQEESAVSAARRAAEEAAGGQRIGGTLNLLGVLSGPQLDAYLSSFEPFEDATGIDLKYEGTRDVNAVLQTRVAGGNPPDLVSNPSAGQMRALAAHGRLVALDDKIDLAAARRDFPAGLIDLATVNGHLYGLFYNSAVNNLVWYDPKHYDGPEPPTTLQELDAYAAKLAGEGRTPYCAGLESGAASGWPGAGWVEQLLLAQSGPAAFDRWVQGRLAWTTPEVKRAFQSFGAVVTDPRMVAGGPTAVLTTSFDKSPQGLVARKPACYLHVQADFLGNLLATSVPGVEPVADIDFYPFPAAAPGQDKAVITSGEMLGAFRDTPQTRAFMKYVASPTFGPMVAGTGQWIGANKQTKLTAYTTPLSRKAAEVYANAETVRYTAQNSMPLAVNQAFLKAVLGYVKDPGSLDAQLARVDEEARRSAAS